jgi:hypothetical protein
MVVEAEEVIWYWGTITAMAEAAGDDPARYQIAWDDLRDVPNTTLGLRCTCEDCAEILGLPEWCTNEQLASV